MAKATVARMPIQVLVPIRDAHGSIVTHEWRAVEGTEVKFEGVELENGDTLTVELTDSAAQDLASSLNSRD